MVRTEQKSDRRRREVADLFVLPRPAKSLQTLSSYHSYPLLSFLDWRHTVSSKFFDTQVTLISTEELVLPRHARCVLSRLCCIGHSLLLGSCLSSIGRIGYPS